LKFNNGWAIIQAGIVTVCYQQLNISRPNYITCQKMLKNCVHLLDDSAFYQFKPVHNYSFLEWTCFIYIIIIECHYIVQMCFYHQLYSKLKYVCYYLAIEAVSCCKVGVNFLCFPQEMRTRKYKEARFCYINIIVEVWR